MKHEDKFEALMLRINPPRKYSLTDAAIRPHPRFADLSEFSKGESFTASVPTVIKTWWVVGLFAIAALWLTIIPMLIVWSTRGWYTDNRGNFFEASFSYTSFLLGVAVLLAATYAILRAIFPRITITATRDGISVGKYRYSWDNAEGLRAGYSVGGVEKSDEQGFFWFKYKGLRMAYGQWSHDLPYMVSDYYSAAYVVWVNQLLETIQTNPETVNDTAAGIKQQMY